MTLLTPERPTTSPGVEPAAAVTSGADGRVGGARPHPGAPAPPRSRTPIRISGRWAITSTTRAATSSTLISTGSAPNQLVGRRLPVYGGRPKGGRPNGGVGVRAAAARPVLADGRAVGGGVRRRGAVRAAGQVGEDRRQVGAGLGRPDPVEPLAVLLRRDPALRVVLGQLLGRRGAVGVADPQLPGLARARLARHRSLPSASAPSYSSSSPATIGSAGRPSSPSASRP